MKAHELAQLLLEMPNIEVMMTSKSAILLPIKDLTITIPSPDGERAVLLLDKPFVE